MVFDRTEFFFDLNGQMCPNLLLKKKLCVKKIESSSVPIGLLKPKKFYSHIVQNITNSP